MIDIRATIDILEAMDHPHARGEDEIFSYGFGTVEFNVDLARRLIKSKEIEATPYQIPIKLGGERLLGMHNYKFGADGKLLYWDPLSTAIGFERAKQIPVEYYDIPALMVMFNEQTAGLSDDDHDFPILIDGNHRLAQRYLDGADGALPCLIIRNMKDILKFATVTPR